MIDRYLKARERVRRLYNNNNNICDRDIIVALEKEIEHYRNKIQGIEYKNIEAESKVYCCGIDGGLKDYQVTSYYADGELIKEIIEPITVER